MSVFDDTQPEATPKPKPKPKPRPRRLGHGRTRTRPRPPVNVQPGWVHELLAALTLRALEESAGASTGAADLGDEFFRHIPGAEDAPEPAVLLARIYAHLAYRLPGVRGVAKRFEGRESRAGLGSDMLALVIQLWLRNRDLVTDFRVRTTAEMQAEHTVRTRAAADPMREGPWREIIFRRFGVKPAAPATPNGAAETQMPPQYAAEEGNRP